MRVKGLDTIRFICAFIVVLSHFSFDLFSDEVVKSSMVLNVINGIFNNSFVGIGAVMVFFIISGFCIHYPYATGKEMNTLQFLLQRVTRIGLPAIVCFAIYELCFGREMGVLWSLICEIFYYIFYPLILTLVRKNKLNVLIAASFVVSVAGTILFSVWTGDYAADSFYRPGFLLTWIMGLPVWLLGVLLAEQYVKGEIPISDFVLKNINVLRLFVWGISVVTSIMKFHLHIGFAYTMLVFSIPAYYWLAAEIRFFSTREEYKLLAFGGTISYSIYLIHQLTLIIFEDILKYEFRDSIFLFSGAVLLTLFFSYIYYICIEKPSHMLAKSIKIN